MKNGSPTQTRALSAELVLTSLAVRTVNVLRKRNGYKSRLPGHGADTAATVAENTIPGASHCKEEDRMTDEMETRDGEPIVWFEASNDGNLEEGWCVWPTKPYEFPVLCEYYEPEKVK